MGRYAYDLGIVGGGAAGLTVAAGAARFGARTILFEKTGRLGGDCLHSGCVPSKALIRIASVRALAARSREFGLPAPDLPPVNLGAVMDRVRSVIAKIQQHDSPERFCSLGAEIRFGSPVFSDDHVVDLDGERISARSWIVATGSSPALPLVEGIEEVPFWTNETVFSQSVLPRHLIVLGGGPVGCEMAQSFRRLGSQVTMVEYLDQILSAEDPDMADVIRTRLVAEGIAVLTNTRAIRAVGTGGRITLRIGPARGEGTPSSLEGDALLIAAGRRPNVDGLGLQSAGVSYTASGIPVNARMKTNIPHIYACGDVNGTMPFTHVAGYEGGIALANAVLRLPRRASYSSVGWCTYIDPEIASIGLNEKRARAEGIEYRLIEEYFAANDRAVTENETGGRLKLLLDAKGKPLGCQIVGPHAGEIIHEWIVAFSGRVSLAGMAGAVHLYPTLSEISKRAAGDYFAEKLFSERTRSLLRTLFSLKGRACGTGEVER
ncbi:MAG TPA: FAD-dependent oxidoreductase [Deltaproteobacteria bacterium]|nr:FAD-dependent oxidoreductase [Deltaproteobacteria bacterium]